MRILLLSDTHGYIDDAICNHARQADQVWHAGDIGDMQVADALEACGPFTAINGNIDNKEISIRYPDEQFFEVEGLKIFMIHIGGYPGQYARGVKQKIKEKSPGLFISGHSHILKVMPDKELNLLHMNPGAAGHHGFHKIRTMIRFEIQNGLIKKPEVIELGIRGRIQ